ncbi:MAG: hypothetical protein EA413_07205 [Cyanobium sp. PLM2.Bin73]|jgi:hypothetical protein|nr:MAG: hypothetical protein EA413_07205 [Cyanobium sp. PLM2.Bin73]
MPARLAIFALLTLAGALPVRASLMNQIVRTHCMRAVNDEVKASRMAAPAGLADFTCNCVVQEMGKGRSVDQASSTCKSQAIRKFNL